MYATGVITNVMLSHARIHLTAHTDAVTNITIHDFMKSDVGKYKSVISRIVLRVFQYTM